MLKKSATFYFTWDEQQSVESCSHAFWSWQWLPLVARSDSTCHSVMSSVRPSSCLSVAGGPPKFFWVKQGATQCYQAFLVCFCFHPHLQELRVPFFFAKWHLSRINIEFWCNLPALSDKCEFVAGADWHRRMVNALWPFEFSGCFSFLFRWVSLCFVLKQDKKHWKQWVVKCQFWSCFDSQFWGEICGRGAGHSLRLKDLTHWFLSPQGWKQSQWHWT